MVYTIIVMDLETDFLPILDSALATKNQWFNNERLVHMLEQYRLLYSCVKNLGDIFIKKSLITPDPYKLDRRISEIIVPENSSFSESENSSVLGSRFSEYETMLDFICTYFRFSVENITMPRIKKLSELNKLFDWENLTVNNAQSNTRALATVLGQARINAAQVLLSTLTDSTDKCRTASSEIDIMLKELSVFQKELFKAKLRKDIFGHPDFNKEQAFTSIENELIEIKKIYPKVMGKKPFYNELIDEIIKEDQAPNKIEIRDKLIKSLKIKEKETIKENKGPDQKELLIQTVISLTTLSPIINQLESKLSENFDLLFEEKKTFWNKLKASLRKAFGLKPKERICNLPISDVKTGTQNIRKINVNEFLLDLDKKKKIYATFIPNSAELEKVYNATEDTVLTFVNHQITENQTIFTTVLALDEYFKSNVDVLLKPKVKGLKIDLATYKNAIITINKKRGEYTYLREENEQMQKLGVR